MDLERIFLHKLYDLRKRSFDWPSVTLNDSEQYEALMAAPLLREILFGSPPLIHEANRKYRLQIRFACSPAVDIPGVSVRPILDFTGTSFDGRGVNPDYVQRLDLDAFLQAPVGLVRDEPISVYDLVDFTANAAGGVHFGPKETKKRAVVKELDDALRVMGWQPSLYSLLAVGRVVVSGLDELRKLVERDHP